MSIVCLRGLSHAYRGRLAVQDLNLEIPQGSIFGFLGPNGAGKTTTIRILLGFLRPSQGQASLFGLDCWKQSAQIKREVGYIPGDLRLYSWMSAASALDLLGKLHGRDMRSAAAPLLERFRLDPGVAVRSMSRGMRQQLGLILALAPRPRLLILDEPTMALDPLMQDQLLDYLQELARQGHTVFFSSHTLAEVERICDRVAILREGRLVAHESMNELRARGQRQVQLTFATPEQAGQCQLPPCLLEQQRFGCSLRCRLQGPVGDLLAWLAGQSLADVTLESPDLESIFRGFYA